MNTLKKVTKSDFLKMEQKAIEAVEFEKQYYIFGNDAFWFKDIEFKNYLKSLSFVDNQMKNDCLTLTKEDFLAKYSAKFLNYFFIKNKKDFENGRHKLYEDNVDNREYVAKYIQKITSGFYRAFILEQYKMYTILNKAEENNRKMVILENDFLDYKAGIDFIIVDFTDNNYKMFYIHSIRGTMTSKLQLNKKLHKQITKDIKREDVYTRKSHKTLPDFKLEKRDFSFFTINKIKESDLLDSYLVIKSIKNSADTLFNDLDNATNQTITDAKDEFTKYKEILKNVRKNSNDYTTNQLYFEKTN